MELDVLPGREVAPATAVTVGDVGQGFQLQRCDRPVRRLDPHHLATAALALTVDAVTQPEQPELVFVHLAVEVGREHPVELGNVGLELARDVPGLDRDGHRAYSYHSRSL